MNRQDKIAAIRDALTDEQRKWLCEVIESASVKEVAVAMFGQTLYREQRVDLTLMSLATEVR